MYPMGLIPKKKEDVDERDLLYSTLFKVNRTADYVELDAYAHLNQGSKGDCTSYGWIAAINRLFRHIMSPIHNYVRTKQIDDFPNDEGSTLTWTAKAGQKFGYATEEDFPESRYKDNEKFDFPEVPADVAEKAAKNKIDMYVKITTREELIDHLMHGNTAVIGKVVGLESYLDPEHNEAGDAIIRMPNGRLAGHVTELCGYNKKKKWTFKSGFEKGKTYSIPWKILQSWGTEDRVNEFTGEVTPAWTKTGYAWMPDDYLFGTMFAPDDSQTRYVNEIFVPLKDVPFEITKIDPGNENITPYIKNERTMLPIRFISETLGMNIEFDEHTRGIIIEDDRGRRIDLTIGSKTIVIDNRTITIDVAPEIVGERTFLPIRAIMEIFGSEVQWFENERRIEIRYKEIILEMWIGRNEARKIKKVVK